MPSGDSSAEFWISSHTTAATIVWKFVSHARSQVSSSYSVADEFRHVFGVRKWCQSKPWCDRNGILLHSGLNSAWQFRLPARFYLVWKWNRFRIAQNDQNNSILRQTKNRDLFGQMKHDSLLHHQNLKKLLWPFFILGKDSCLFITKLNFALFWCGQQFLCKLSQMPPLKSVLVHTRRFANSISPLLFWIFWNFLSSILRVKHWQENRLFPDNTYLQNKIIEVDRMLLKYNLLEKWVKITMTQRPCQKWLITTNFFNKIKF